MNTRINLSTTLIVATPAQAMDAFQTRGVDLVALDGHVVRKTDDSTH